MAEKRRQNVLPEVFQVIKQYPGETLSINEVIERANDNNDNPYTGDQVANALSKMTTRFPGWGVRRMGGRGMYAYLPNAAKEYEEQQNKKESEVIFRAIKVYDDGRAILEGTDNDVYIAQKLDGNIWNRLWGDK